MRFAARYLAVAALAFASGSGAWVLQGCESDAESTGPSPSVGGSTAVGGGTSIGGATSGGGGSSVGGQGGGSVGGSGGEAGGGPCVPVDELCDGLDNDCDEAIDEDCPCIEGDEQDCYSGDPLLIGTGECLAGVQICDLQGVWGSCEDEVLPIDEACDGLDNDCDGSTDEELDTITCGLGICQVTVPACEAGQPVPCVPGSAQPPEECEGMDDDCDGTVDEGCSCLNDQQQPCYSGAPETQNVGACHDGAQICTNGAWGACLNDQTPSTEQCDGIDNDCDATIDDGDPEGGTICDTGLSGICAAGVRHCVDAELSCVPNEQPGVELCDGLDNDCDPGTADGADEPQGGTLCDGADADLCDEGLRYCSAGAIACSDATGNTLDVCDGLDNDCDIGSADGSEDPQAGVACDGADSDLCIEGTSVCVAGALSCSDTTGGSLDLCDGVDNDCDPASADGAEDPLVGATCDGPDGDLCLEGTRSCVGGSLVCSDTTGDALDVCDGVDNDCDSASADGSEDPGLGVACDGSDGDLCQEGTRACIGGSLLCSDTTGSTLDVCDGVDNDCNPATPDGSQDPLVGVSCDGADSDLCKEGVTSCSGGLVVCSDTTGGTLDVCDGQDNDCDPGSADGSEDPQLGAACDGPDSDLCTEGVRACVGGALLCSDTTGNSADVCDGVDNDCDPSSPDGSEDAQIGGACDGSDVDLCPDGAWTCPAGSLVCSDGPGTGLDVCDGVDNDCNPATPDGSQDPLVGTACDGSDGDLCTEGTYSCGGGSLQCSDNTGTTSDVCDGGDNDCDPSSADGAEDPLVGVACDGADSDLCKEGVSSCVAGSVVCSDTSGSTFDACDGQDNDCDPASADGAEDPLVGVACDGLDSDLCKEGTSSCTAGAVVCSDTTGSTTDLCNGGDDDCDPASADGAEDPLVGVACDGPDSDLCKEGTSSCAGGSVVCSDASGSTVDLCNSLDDDCDPASADGSEDPLNGQACDGPDSDLCQEGTNACSSGTIVCGDATASTTDLCNGTDDDCDSASADGSEDPLVNVSCDGADSDLCREGTSACPSGSVTCSDTTGDTLEICANGLDEDCDGTADDGCGGCSAGTADCDGNPSNGCECATTGCCATNCEGVPIVHDNGIGQTWGDCVPQYTYDQAQAMKACQASPDAAFCTALTCGGGGVVCTYGAENCICWSYGGSYAGRVFDQSPQKSCYCGMGAVWY